MEEIVFSRDILGESIPCEYIQTPEKAISAMSVLGAKDTLFGVDIETTPKKEYREYPNASFSPHLSDIRMLQIYDGEKCYVFDCYYLPFEIFIPFLDEKRCIAHNAMFELSFFLKNGVGNMSLGCTLIMGRILFHAVYPTDAGLSASLDSLVQFFFKVELNKACQSSDFGGNLTFEQVEYAADDAIWCHKLALKMQNGLTKLSLWDTYQSTKDVQYAATCMQLNGMILDVPYYRKLIETWKAELFDSRKEVLEITGLDQITGAKLSDWLKENLPPEIIASWPRTDPEDEHCDRLSTAANTLIDFDYLPIVAPFAKYQKRAKLVSTYGNTLLSKINPETGRLHAKYNICGARTGRWSSSSPNLQQCPRDLEVRAAYVAPEGYKYIGADYSQIEVRVIAELSQDKLLLKCFREGRDVYRFVASIVLNKKYELVTDLERQKMKAVVLGRMYGLGAAKFCSYAKASYGVEIPDEEGVEFITEFKEMFEGITAFQLKQAAIGEATYQIRTVGGKLRKLRKDKYYGAALNTPIQGAAGEIINRALVRLTPYFPYGGEVSFINQVHDEIGMFCPEDEEILQPVLQVVEQEMVGAFLDFFPTGITNGLIEVKVGNNWAEAH